MYAFRNRMRPAKKKCDKLNCAVGPKHLGALSRQVDDDLLVKLQVTINKGIADKPENATSVFIRTSEHGLTNSVIKRLEAFYVEAGWASASWDSSNVGLSLKK